MVWSSYVLSVNLLLDVKYGLEFIWQRHLVLHYRHIQHITCGVKRQESGFYAHVFKIHVYFLFFNNQALLIYDLNCHVVVWRSHKESTQTPSVSFSEQISVLYHQEASIKVIFPPCTLWIFTLQKPREAASWGYCEKDSHQLFMCWPAIFLNVCICLTADSGRGSYLLPRLSVYTNVTLWSC